MSNENKSSEKIDFEDLACKLEQSDDYRVLRRLPPPVIRDSDLEDGEFFGVYVDCETTGTEHRRDEIIELAMVQFKYKGTGEILGITCAYNSFHQPKVQIPSKITEITGITDEMVAGKQIDLYEVERIVDEVSVVIAHNAAFDRRFLEHLSDKFARINWACSFNDIPWKREGLRGAKLDYIGNEYGFFYDGDRAENDCFAGIEVLKQKLPKSGRPCFKVLLENARQNTKIIWAVGIPYEKRDDIKRRGYRWSSGIRGNPKSWYIEIPERVFEEEMNFLMEEIYGYEKRIPVHTITAMTRYSRRT